MCTHMATVADVPEERVSVRELRNTVSALLRRVEAGQFVTVTVDGRPVATLAPIRPKRMVTMVAATVIANRYPADRGMAHELAEIFNETTDDE